MRSAPHGLMLVAGEASGDLLAAELVRSLRASAPWAGWAMPPRLFGAGGAQMRAAGVELEVELTRHAVVGLTDVLRRLREFRRLLHELADLACRRQPDVLIGVDFSAFNLRLIRAVRRRLAGRAGEFRNWRPRFVQYVSPQVWASRPSRAYAMARELDLLLCLFPFEREWYARRVPELRVELVGHPLLDRHRLPAPGDDAPGEAGGPTLLLLPGSRVGELERHLPVLLEAAAQLRGAMPLRVEMVLPDERLRGVAERLGARPGADLAIQIGGLAQALGRATVALASTGTVTLECALFGVPTVALYKTSWATYQVGRRLATVEYMAMPNLLAGAVVFPEFIQDAATPGALATAAGELLRDPVRRRAARERLFRLREELGGPGASARAAAAILAPWNGKE